MPEYRLKPLAVVRVGSRGWNIGGDGMIVCGDLSEVAPGRFHLTICCEVATDTTSEGTSTHIVGSVEEAVALVEAKRLEAFKYDVEPIESSGANPAPESPAE